MDDAVGVRRQSVGELWGVVHRVAWCDGALLSGQLLAFEQG